MSYQYHTSWGGCERSIAAFFEALGLTNFMINFQRDGDHLVMNPRELEFLLRNRSGPGSDSEAVRLYRYRARRLYTRPEFYNADDGTRYTFFSVWLVNGHFHLKVKIKEWKLSPYIRTEALDDIAFRLGLLPRRSFSFSHRPRAQRFGQIA